MPIDPGILRADLAAMRSDFPSSLAWSGQTISVVCSPVSSADDVQPDGVFNERECEASAVISDFSGSTIPRCRDVVAVDGVKYHITSIDSDGVVARMSLRRI